MRRLAALLCVAVLTASCSSTTSGSGRTQGAGEPCGGRTVTGPGGQRWRCTFDDEFTGSRLDPRRWAVVRTNQYGFHTGPECYVDDGRHVRVSGGTLVLTATRGGSCPTTRSPYESGMVNTLGRFAQRYGRFEIRARLPATQGVQPALWLYPQRTSYGPWPRSGEIDIAEIFGRSDGSVSPHLHYLGLGGVRARPGAACHVTDPGGSMHVYGVTWTPASIVFDYDGHRCFAASWTPAPPLVAPAPFDRPFAVELELALGGLTSPAPTASTRLPVAMQVDYVRVWGS